jgi:hypothetical protein
MMGVTGRCGGHVNLGARGEFEGESDCAEV